MLTEPYCGCVSEKQKSAAGQQLNTKLQPFASPQRPAAHSEEGLCVHAAGEQMLGAEDLTRDPDPLPQGGSDSGSIKSSQPAVSEQPVKDAERKGPRTHRDAALSCDGLTLSPPGNDCASCW